MQPSIHPVTVASTKKVSYDAKCGLFTSFARLDLKGCGHENAPGENAGAYR